MKGLAPWYSFANSTAVEMCCQKNGGRYDPAKFPDYNVTSVCYPPDPNNTAWADIFLGCAHDEKLIHPPAPDVPDPSGALGTALGWRGILGVTGAVAAAVLTAL